MCPPHPDRVRRNYETVEVEMFLFQATLRVEGNNRPSGTYWIVSETARQALEQAYAEFQVDVRQYDNVDAIELVSLERIDGPVIVCS